MKTEPLQKFDYKESPYLRPNQDWVCGHAASGQACPRGPGAKGHCSGGQQCDPAQSGGRWICTRSDLHGGACANGPLPDGRCGDALPPCQPHRSIKARRRLTTRWTAVFVIGLLLALVGGERGLALLEPGPRIHAHAQLGSCDACHAATEHSLLSWPRLASSGEPDDSQRCLRCHAVGESPKMAHGLSARSRAALKPASATAPAGPAVAFAASMLVDPDASLECGQCHQEHRGQDADLTTLSNGRCQSCHSEQFASFRHGHPDFEHYPSNRRTRIQFDHAEHIAKHFPDGGAAAPQACADCHETATQGGMMVLRGFEPACGACHAPDIAGAGRADSPGLALLQVPGFDLDSLSKAGLATGAWPEFAESQGGAFFAALMQQDAEASAALKRLENADWLDLEAAPIEQLRDAQTLLWAYKKLLLDLRRRGPAHFVKRLQGAGMIPSELAPQELVRGLSVDTVEAAINAWFPELESEWSLYQAGELPASPPAAQVPASEPEPEESFDASEFDDLFGGGGDDIDLFGGGDEINLDALSLDEEEPETTADDEDTNEPASLDKRMQVGGWYLDDMSLRYRPVGHADALLKAWLDHAQAPAVRQHMLDPGSPGRCIKCHSVDESAQGLVVNWQVRRPNRHLHEFTKFSHQAHFSLMGEEGCTGCHQLDPEADYAAAFSGTDPAQFASNFHSLDKGTCAECHGSTQAGDRCTSCHNYHIGEFAATEPVSKLSLALQNGEGP